MTQLPATLFAWKTHEGSATPFWELLRPFFAEHGLHLWDDGQGYARPAQADQIREPDEYHHRLPYIEPNPPGMPLQRTIHFPARSTENKDVLIRLIVKGKDGLEHLNVLKALAEIDTEQQHFLPLLQLLEKEDMVFAVFPLVCANDDVAWFHDLDEVLQCCEQVFHSFAILNEHRIAHRDFGSGEILLNFGGGFTQPIDDFGPIDSTTHIYTKWRNLFPLRYYLNDFELAVQFPADSDPSTRLVEGIPTAAWGHTSQDYLKELAPESLNEEPYCPMKADVYQVGFCSGEIFCRAKQAPELINLLQSMLWTDPSLRITFAEAHAGIVAIRQSLSPEVLASPVQENLCAPWASHILPENRIDPYEEPAMTPAEYEAQLKALENFTFADFGFSE